MTELNVPMWVFLIIWFSLIFGVAAGGWFLRGMWDRETKKELAPPPDDFDDRNAAGKRNKW